MGEDIVEDMQEQADHDFRHSQLSKLRAEIARLSADNERLKNLNLVKAKEAGMWEAEARDARSELDRLKARIADERQRQEAYDANDWKQD